MAPEKRRFPRVAPGQGASGLIRASVPVLVRDISSHGVRLQTATSVHPGTVYDLSASLPGLGLSVAVRITRCRCEGSQRNRRGDRVLVYEAGGEFVFRGDADRGSLAEWLAARTAPGPDVAAELAPAS